MRQPNRPFGTSKRTYLRLLIADIRGRRLRVKSVNRPNDAERRLLRVEGSLSGATARRLPSGAETLDALLREPSAAHLSEPVCLWPDMSGVVACASRGSIREFPTAPMVPCGPVDTRGLA